MIEYRAIAFQQNEQAPRVILFAAPATDIAAWAGVPQRELVEGQETIGFQREENPTRINQLRRFLDDSRNVIQNPILCASRNFSKVAFESDRDVSGCVISGMVTIDVPDFSSRTLESLFSELETQLRERQPDLAKASYGQEQLLALQRRLQEAVGDETSLEYMEEDQPAEEDDDSVGGLFAKETHILEFWQEVKMRQYLIQHLSAEDIQRFEEEGSFLGFSRDLLESYLRPVFLVDGQHRLSSAVKSAQQAAARAILEGEVDGISPDDDTAEIARRYARVLPVSLLLDDKVAEHVFQFVVVNQKATPVGKALLGTIVASSLTEQELDGVASRLESVGIKVSDSQAVSWFTRNRNSPFYGLVQQGMTGEGGEKLPWSVLRDLVSIFRNLQGGRLFHDNPAVDYADIWRRNQLIESALVTSEIDPQEPSALSDAYSYWKTLDGPWVEVCTAFYTAIRDRLADSQNPYAPNGWGSTKSNLFNKISLWILTADFFQYLTDRGYTLDSADDVRAKVAEWLRDVDKAYFARDWNLAGIKKDTPGIRAQWAALWVSYRKDPGDLRKIKATEFRKARPVG